MPSHSSAPRGRVVVTICAVAGLLLSLMTTAAFGIQRSARAQGTTPGAVAIVPATAPLYVTVATGPHSAQWVRGAEIVREIGLGAEIDSLLAVMNDGLSETFGPGAEAKLADSEIAVVGMDAASLIGAAQGDGDDSGSGLIGIVYLPRGAADLFAAEQRSLQDDGSSPERSTYNGVTILATDTEATATFGDYVVIADTPQDLQPVIDVRAGDLPSLADAAAYTLLRNDLPAEMIAFAYADGQRFRQPLQRMMIDDITLAPFISAVLTQSDHRLALALWADDAGLRLDLRLSPGTGIDAPVASTGTTLTLDRALPAGTALVFNGTALGTSDGFELLALLVAQGVATVVTDQTGEFLLEPAQYFAAAERVLGFDLRDGLTRHLTGEYALAASATSLDIGGVDAVLVSGIDDPVSVADAAAKLSVLINGASFDQTGGLGTVSTRTVDGGLIQVLDLPIDEAGANVHVEFGVVGDRLLVGYRSGLADFLAGSAATLADNPRYQTAFAALPAEREWQLYIDLGALLPLAQQADQSFAEATAMIDPAAVRSLAAVGFTHDGMRGMSLVLAVADSDGVADATPVAG